MIARLFGKVVEKGLDHAVLDVGGVGYKVFASVGTLASLPPPGGEAALRVHTHVAEAALDLYGFADALEEQVFHCLLGAPNIGCKKAIQMLSGLPAEEIVDAVRSEDAKRLAGAHGVGKKTAERLVVELKDRIGALSASVPVSSKKAPEPALENLLEQLMSGLVGLGFKIDQARGAAESTLEDLGEDELPVLLRDALRRLRRG